MLYRFARSILNFILHSHSEICENKKKHKNGLQKTPILAPKVSLPYLLHKLLKEETSKKSGKLRRKINPDEPSGQVQITV